MKVAFLAATATAMLKGAYAQGNCYSISPVASDEWCNSNCNFSPPYCPEELCECDGSAPPSPTNAPPTAAPPTTAPPGSAPTNAPPVATPTNPPPSSGSNTVDRDTYWSRFYDLYGMNVPGPAPTTFKGAEIEGSVGWYNIIFDLNEVQNANIMDPDRPGKQCLWDSGASSGPGAVCGYPQYLSVDAAVNAFMKFGVPASKLVMGAAHYGRVFRNVDTSSTPTNGDYNDKGMNSVFSGMCSWDFWDCFRDSNGVPLDPKPETGTAYCMGWSENDRMEPIQCEVEGWMTEYNITDEPRFVAYKDIKRFIDEEPDWEYQFDNSALAPFLWNERKGYYITFDDERSIKHKADYVNMYDLAGLMYWQMGQDDEQLTLTSAMDDTLEDGKVRLGYYLLEAQVGGGQNPSDGRGVDPADIPWSKLNRVHLSFFNIEGMGDEGEAPFEVTVPRDIRSDPEVYENWVKTLMKMFRERDSQNPTCEIAIAVGGWGYANRNAPDAYAYSAGIASAASRQTLITSTVDILELNFIKENFPEFAEEIEANDWHFSIFDMDWEYPGQKTNAKIWSAELNRPIGCFETEQGMSGDLSGCEWGDEAISADVTNLAALFREFKAYDSANGKRGYLTTIASAGAIYSMSFLLKDLTELADSLDFINLMTYDYSGPWLQRPPVAGGYGNVDCSFDSSTWTWWLCSGGYEAGATTNHHTNLYPSVFGLNNVACAEENSDGCWDGVARVDPPLYGAWRTSSWNSDPCQLDSYGQIFWRSEAECREAGGVEVVEETSVLAETM